MMENELSRIWKSSPPQEQVKFDKSRLILDVQTSLDAFHKQVKVMYIREALGAFVVIPMFSIYAYLAPHILTKIGFALIVLCAFYILYVLKKSKDKAPNQFSMSYLEYLRKTEEFLEYSQKKRENVLVWYVLPMIVPVWIAMFGLYLDDPDTLIGLYVTIAISLAASAGIHFLNNRSAKKMVAPKLEKVKGLIASLEE